MPDSALSATLVPHLPGTNRSTGPPARFYVPARPQCQGLYNNPTIRENEVSRAGFFARCPVAAVPDRDGLPQGGGRLAVRYCHVWKARPDQLDDYLQELNKKEKMDGRTQRGK